MEKEISNENLEGFLLKIPIVRIERAESGDIEQVIFKLPVGFRFNPTDEELILHYLKSKVFCLPLPVPVIPEAQIFQLSPWDLPGELKEKRCFFTKPEANMSSDPCGGYWVASNRREKLICARASKGVIGVRKSYVYYPGKESGGHEKVEWVMHEFTLPAPLSMMVDDWAAPRSMMVEDWVVCRVYQRKKKKKNQASNDNKSEEPGPSSPQTTSCTSGITQIGCSCDLV